MPFSTADSYGKRSQPSGSKIPLQGRRCYAFGSPAKSGLSLQWKEIGVGASVGVSVNIHLGVPTRTCPGFVITKARLHLNFLLSDYRRACSSGGRGNWLVYSNLATVSRQPFEALECFPEIKSCCSATLQSTSEKKLSPYFGQKNEILIGIVHLNRTPCVFFPADAPIAVTSSKSPMPAQIKVKGCINSHSELKLPRFFNLVLGLVQEKRQSLLLRYLC